MAHVLEPIWRTFRRGRELRSTEKRLCPSDLQTSPPCRRPGGGQVVRLAALAFIFAGFCRKYARRWGAFLFILS